MLEDGKILIGKSTKPEYLDLWYPAPDVDALLRYLEGYAPHGYGAKWP